MVKTLVKIDGMMCGMCEAHVNDAIRKAIPDASKVKSKHRKGECSFVTVDNPDEDIIRKALEDTGYKVISIEHE